MLDVTKVAETVLTVVKKHLDTAISALTKRLDALEAVSPREGRDGLPGLPGRDGAPGIDGKDGQPGKDGAKGFDLENFDAELMEDGRTVLLSFTGGDIVFKVELAFPVMLYRGVFKEGQSYTVGDVVTWAGSLFHCCEDTSEKPETTKAWTLAVKRGRDGKDGSKPETKGLPKIKRGGSNDGN